MIAASNDVAYAFPSIPLWLTVIVPLFLIIGMAWVIAAFIEPKAQENFHQFALLRVKWAYVVAPLQIRRAEREPVDRD